MATLTITTTAEQDARIVEAYGYHLNLGRNATAQEVKASVINQIRNLVQGYEKDKAVRDAVTTVTPFDPS